MTRYACTTTLATSLIVVGACTGPAKNVATSCAELTALTLNNSSITKTENIRASGTSPSHCKVTGVIETEINFELLLPEEWNGRFMMGGGGGYVGTVQNSALSYGALEQGYATVGTDTGHVGGGIEASWAFNNPERQENFGHRAIHLTAEVAKALIEHHYSQAPEYSYFIGCSRGGGQGMMESQRYPNDFDGIVAGAPAYYWTALTAGFVQTQQAIYPTGDTNNPVLTPENLELLSSSILSACDETDGVKDGMMTDPRQCPFSPTDLPLCPNDTSAADCVTSRQLAAIQAVYNGPTANDEQLFFGFNYGGENEPGGWDSWVVGGGPLQMPGMPNAHYGFGTELYKYFVFNDPEWDYTKYDFSTWRTDTAAASKILDAIDTDLSAFRNQNGKIIYWTGWSDLALTPLGTINYYEELEARDNDVRDYARLYMLPGVLHCANGPGPDQVDWVEAIRTWVEDGQAPDRLVASKRNQDGQIALTRPVCPYPEIAVYDGSGDSNNESSFTCTIPE